MAFVQAAAVVRSLGGMMGLHCESATIDLGTLMVRVTAESVAATDFRPGPQRPHVRDVEGSLIYCPLADVGVRDSDMP